MNTPPINGNEFQLEGFQVVVHDETVEEIKEKARKALQRVFKGESAHKIIRVNYQRGQKSFLFNATFEKEMYNEVMAWVEETMNREYRPIVYEFRNFLSFTPPNLV